MRWPRFNPKGPIKDWQRRMLLRKHGIGVEVDVPTFEAGARSGTWSVVPDGLGPHSVVYSFGVGANVAWDLAMIERFGMPVHAFDPTPRAVAWVAEQDLPRELVFEPVGLGARDGDMAFAPPRRGKGVDYHPVAGDVPAGGVQCPVRTLATLQREHGHDRIDVLKLDIEGGEYAVIDDIVAAAPGQLLIEFHHRADGRDFEITAEALGKLRDAGYRVFWISHRGVEMALVRTG